MNLNPEFQRQLYLEASQGRLIGIPLVLGIIFTFAFTIDDYRLAGATASSAFTLFMLIALLWGPRQTVDSIVEEYQDRTWDIQRLSALNPWEMTWGKWLGSTVMVWYAGLICLLVFGLATDNVAALPSLTFYTLSTGLLVQGCGLLLGLLAVRRGQIKSGSILLLAILGFLFLAPWLGSLSKLPPPHRGYFPETPEIAWYGLSIGLSPFNQASLMLALFWCGVGNYRLMALELGVRTLPWAWLGFSAFLIIYLGGFIPSSSYSFSLAAFLTCGALTYIGILVERNDAMRLKHLIAYLQQHNWRRAGEELPIWWPTLILTLPFALALSLSDHPFRDLSTRFHFYPLPIALLMLRDCTLYLYFYFGKNPQRALASTLLTGVLVYGILPGLFTTFGLTGIAAWFFPLWADSAAGAFFYAILQTGILLSLLHKRWRQNT